MEYIRIEVTERFEFKYRCTAAIILAIFLEYQVSGARITVSDFLIESFSEIVKFLIKNFVEEIGALISKKHQFKPRHKSLFVAIFGPYRLSRF